MYVEGGKDLIKTKWYVSHIESDRHCDHIDGFCFMCHVLFGRDGRGSNGW